MMGLDNALWLAGGAAELVLIVLLIYRRAWRILPIFATYCVYDLVSNVVNLPVSRIFPNAYSPVFLIETVIDSLFGFCILVELGWSVLRPIRSSLPRWTIALLACLILAAGVAVWPFSNLQIFLNQLPYLQVILRVQQTASILRILMFLLLAAASQLLSIGWKDRELQVASGLGFYSLVSLAAAMFRAHGASVTQFGHLNEFVNASYLCSLLYWAFCFARKEAERRDFTPQMRNLLLAAAGVARSQRMALSEVDKSGPRNGGRL